MTSRVIALVGLLLPFGRLAAQNSAVASFNPHRQACALIANPTDLPAAAELLDTAQFFGFVRTLPPASVERWRVHAALYFSKDGAFAGAHLIESTLADSLARSIVQFAMSAARDQAPRPSPWGVRVAVVPGASEPLVVARSEYCKPKPMVARSADAPAHSSRGNPNVLDVSQEWIRLAVLVDTSGRVQAATLIDSPRTLPTEDLRHWMVSSVYRIRYYPGLVNGKPVAMVDTTRERLVVTREIRRVP